VGKGGGRLRAARGKRVKKHTGGCDLQVKGGLKKKSGEEGGDRGPSTCPLLAEGRHRHSSCEEKQPKKRKGRGFSFPFLWGGGENKVTSERTRVCYLTPDHRIFNELRFSSAEAKGGNPVSHFYATDVEGRGRLGKGKDGALTIRRSLWRGKLRSLGAPIPEIIGGARVGVIHYCPSGREAVAEPAHAPKPEIKKAGSILAAQHWLEKASDHRDHLITWGTEDAGGVGASRERVDREICRDIVFRIPPENTQGGRKVAAISY